MNEKIQTLHLTDSNGYNGYHATEGYFFPLNIGGTKDNPVLVPNNVFSCREEFAERFDIESRYVGFAATHMNSELVQKFWDLIAEKLGEKFRVTVFNTQFPNFILLKLPTAWTENDTVRGMFSLLLRASGPHYYRGAENFDTSFGAYSLLARCRSAVNWFLQGYTKPIFNKLPAGGLVSSFSYHTAEMLKRDLLKPE
jgi:hypothetical protein